MNPGAQAPERKVRQPKPPKGGPVFRVVISLLITLIFGGIYFYLKLPALNIHNEGLYSFVILLCIVFSV